MPNKLPLARFDRLCYHHTNNKRHKGFDKEEYIFEPVLERRCPVKTFTGDDMEGAFELWLEREFP